MHALSIVITVSLRLGPGSRFTLLSGTAILVLRVTGHGKYMVIVTAASVSTQTQVISAYTEETSAYIEEIYVLGLSEVFPFHKKNLEGQKLSYYWRPCGV